MTGRTVWAGVPGSLVGDDVAVLWELPWPPYPMSISSAVAASAMSEELRIRLSMRAGSVCLIVAGHMDFSTAHTLSRVTVAVLHTRAAVSLALDMSAVTFVDAAGVAAVIACKGEAVRRNLPFSVVDPSVPVAAMMRLCGVADLLGIAACDSPGAWPERATCAPRYRDGVRHTSRRQGQGGRSL